MHDLKPSWVQLEVALAPAFLPESPPALTGELSARQNGRALRYSGLAPCNNLEVVLEAVRQNGRARRYAGLPLRNDREVVLEAFRRTDNLVPLVCLQHHPSVVAQRLVGIFTDPLGIGIELKPENDTCRRVLLLDEVEELAHRIAIVRIAAIPESANGIGLARDLLREKFPHRSVPAKTHPQHDRFHSRLLENSEIEFLFGLMDRSPVATNHIGKYR